MKRKENNAPTLREVISKTFKIIKEYKKSYILIVIFCILAAIFGSIAPYFLGYATDSLYGSISKGIDFNYTYLSKILFLVL